jgi:hypothetical protein
VSNVNRLIAHKMSLDALPVGGGVVDGIRYLSDKERLSRSAREAKEWVAAAIVAVRSAADPNPWRDKSDEEISGDLLAKIKQVEAGRR